MDSPILLAVTSEHIRFYCLVVGSVRYRFKLTHALETFVIIAQGKSGPA